MMALRAVNPTMGTEECALMFASTSTPREAKIIILPNIETAQKFSNSTIWLYMEQFLEKSILTTTDIHIFEKIVGEGGEIEDGDVLTPKFITLEEMKVLFKFHLPFRVYINSPEVLEVYTEAVLRYKLIPNTASMYFSADMAEACTQLVGENQIEVLAEFSL